MTSYHDPTSQVLRSQNQNLAGAVDRARRSEETRSAPSATQRPVGRLRDSLDQTVAALATIITIV